VEGALCFAFQGLFFWAQKKGRGFFWGPHPIKKQKKKPPEKKGEGAT